MLRSALKDYTAQNVVYLGALFMKLSVPENFQKSPKMAENFQKAPYVNLQKPSKTSVNAQ